MVRYRARQRQEREEKARRVGESAETRTSSEILTLIGKGEVKCSDFTALHNIPDMRGCHERFYTSIEDYKTTQWYHCPYSHERGPHARRATRSEVRDECTRCHESRQKNNGVRKFTIGNDMDPFPNGYPHHLPKLSPIEETLISRSHPVMKFYRMKGTGQAMYKGNVVNLQKETDLIQCPQAAFEELPIFYFVRVDHPNAPTHRYFRCRRDAVRKWLEYLTQNHPYYCNLPIQWQRLQEFPEDGNVSYRIQCVTLQQPTRTNMDQTGGRSQQE